MSEGFEAVWSLLQPIIAGLVAGLIASAIGYIKTNAEKFEAEKFFITVALGAIVGAIGGYMGISYASAEIYLANIGAVYLIDYILKAIWRRWIAPLMLKQASKASKPPGEG
jgi:hypothetical protein